MLERVSSNINISIIVVMYISYRCLVNCLVDIRNQHLLLSPALTTSCVRAKATSSSCRCFCCQFVSTWQLQIELQITSAACKIACIGLLQLTRVKMQLPCTVKCAPGCAPGNTQTSFTSLYDQADIPVGGPSCGPVAMLDPPLPAAVQDFNPLGSSLGGVVPWM